MHRLNFELRQLCLRNRHGSHSTQATRLRLLNLIANQLHELGYERMRATSLKPKHVERLVMYWQELELKTGPVKNRMSALRWWAERINKSVVEPSNAHYGIEQRSFIPEDSQAQVLNLEKLERIEDPYTKLSVRLQAAFGLRREEAIKFRPGIADRGDTLHLKGSWTKGGKARVIPIRTYQQRRLLAEVHAHCGAGALIPTDMNYSAQLKRHEHHIHKVGFRKLHGLRHQYAQVRFRELAGFDCPAAGGPKKADLTPDQRTADYSARVVVSRELGHEREQITATYLGR